MLENTKNMAINKAVKVVCDMSEDTRIQELVRMREKSLHDYASEIGDAEDRGIQIGIKKGIEQGLEQGLEQGREQGLQEGREQGREETRKEAREIMAKTLRELGLDEDIIQQKIAKI